MSKIIFTNTYGRMDGIYTASNNNQDSKIALLLQSSDYNQKINIAEKDILQKVFNLLVYLGYDSLWIKIYNDQPYDSINNLLYTSDALDWLQSKVSLAGDCLVLGNVYATWTLMQLVMRRPEIKKFILLSPLFCFDNFNFMHPCPIPGLIIQGNKNNLAESEKLKNIIQEIRNMTSAKIDLQIFANSDQSLSNDVIPLLRILYRYLVHDKQLKYVKKEVMHHGRFFADR